MAWRAVSYDDEAGSYWTLPHGGVGTRWAAMAAGFGQPVDADVATSYWHATRDLSARGAGRRQGIPAVAGGARRGTVFWPHRGLPSRGGGGDGGGRGGGGDVRVRGAEVGGEGRMMLSDTSTLSVSLRYYLHCVYALTTSSSTIVLNIGTVWQSFR